MLSYLYSLKRGARITVWNCAGLERKGLSNQAVIPVCDLTGTLVLLLGV